MASTSTGPQVGLTIYFQNYLDRDNVPQAVQIVSKIGAGTYGQVYSAVEAGTNRKFALKCMQITEQRGITSLMDISVSCTVVAPGLVTALDITVYQKWIYLLQELATEDMFSYIYIHKLPVTNFKRWVYQLIYSLNILNHAGTIHGDIKPNNLLYYQGSDTVKICDFTLAIHKNWLRLYRGMIGSGNYRAPEIWLDKTSAGQGYDERIDVWSLGCVIFEIFYRRPIIRYQARHKESHEIETKRMYNCFSEWAQYTDQLWTHPTYTDESYDKPFLPPAAQDKRNLFWDFLHRMLQIDYHRRSRWPELLNHPYLSGINLSSKYSIRTTFQKSLQLSERQRMHQVLEGQIKNELVREFVIELYSRISTLSTLREDQKIAGCIYIATKLVSAIPITVRNFTLKEILNIELEIARYLSFRLHFSFIEQQPQE